MPKRAIYFGAFIHSASLKKLDICGHGMIGVDETGKIAFILRGVEETVPDGWEDADTIWAEDDEPGRGFFFPGFIDTHIHASQYPNSGIFGESTLLDWLNTYTFPLEASFEDIERAQKIYSRVVDRTIGNGTTTACYFATRHVEATNLLADICLSKGQRAFVGRVCMDHEELCPEYYRDESAEVSCQRAKECIEHVRAIDPGFELVSPIITPRFAPSCSKEAMTALGALHKETGVPVQTHLCENKPEIELVRQLFPDSKHYTDVYDSTGLLTDKAILAHCVWLTDDERKMIKARNAGISHCPASNTALTSGCAPIRQLLNEGLKVGLGTDVSGGYTPSILAETREALFVSRYRAMSEGDEAARLNVAEALYLATRGGAKVVGLEERIGGFEVGMDWDAQLIRLGEVGQDIDGRLDQSLDGPVDLFGHESWEDRIAKWVYTGDDRNTLGVWVKGRLVHRREGWKP